jgi:hypothetical protein
MNQVPTTKMAARLSIRRAQIAAVAVGSVGSLLMLGGLAGRSVLVAQIGFAVFALALIVVFTLGVLSWWSPERE